MTWAVVGYHWPRRHIMDRYAIYLIITVRTIIVPTTSTSLSVDQLFSIGMHVDPSEDIIHSQNRKFGPIEIF